MIKRRLEDILDVRDVISVKGDGPGNGAILVCSGLHPQGYLMVDEITGAGKETFFWLPAEIPPFTKLFRYEGSLPQKVTEIPEGYASFLADLRSHSGLLREAVTEGFKISYVKHSPDMTSVRLGASSQLRLTDDLQDSVFSSALYFPVKGNLRALLLGAKLSTFNRVWKIGIEDLKGESHSQNYHAKKQQVNANLKRVLTAYESRNIILTYPDQMKIPEVGMPDMGKDITFNATFAPNIREARESLAVRLGEVRALY